MARKVTIKPGFVAISALAIFVAIMLWDRRGKEIEDPNPLNYKEEGDHRVLPRSKRQSSFKKHFQLTEQVSNVMACCTRDMPFFFDEQALKACPLPNNDNACNYDKKRLKRQRGRARSAPRNLNWLGQIRQALLGGKSAAKKAPKNKAGQSWSSISTEEGNRFSKRTLCYNECLFTKMGYMVSPPSIDLEAYEKTFYELNDNSTYWVPRFNDALAICEEKSACASPEAISIQKKNRNIRPTILTLCMFQQLFSGCLPKKTRECDKAVNTFSRANVYNAYKN
ncbi:uncharacterized protein LOC135945852 [Cloeon dipterum]|uniref:uncharacterized protein LOC135945852 n=1 Tax=Cloeon dipterum TaxID=197152 RepID=UPI003220290D